MNKVLHVHLYDFVKIVRSDGSEYRGTIRSINDAGCQVRIEYEDGKTRTLFVSWKRISKVSLLEKIKRKLIKNVYETMGNSNNNRCSS